MADRPGIPDPPSPGREVHAACQWAMTRLNKGCWWILRVRFRRVGASGKLEGPSAVFEAAPEAAHGSGRQRGVASFEGRLDAFAIRLDVHAKIPQPLTRRGHLAWPLHPRIRSRCPGQSTRSTSSGAVKERRRSRPRLPDRDSRFDPLGPTPPSACIVRRACPLPSRDRLARGRAVQRHKHGE